MPDVGEDMVFHREVDSSGYAALSLMPPGRGVLTTEFKINLVAPAASERIIARGRVVKQAGR